jgi:outer membrane protein assembly factor BamE
MRASMLSAVLLPLALFVAGCQLVYTLPTRQGNVIEQKKLDQLQLGMTREQVRYLLGTPLAASPFDTDRWDYLGYYRSPRGAEAERTVSLYFVDGALARMEGITLADAKSAIETPDLEAVVEEEERALLEAERKESEDRGVIIRQEEDASAPGTPAP